MEKEREENVVLAPCKPTTIKRVGKRCNSERVEWSQALTVEGKEGVTTKLIPFLPVVDCHTFPWYLYFVHALLSFLAKIKEKIYSDIHYLLEAQESPWVWYER